MVLELHVWGPAFGIPSIDAECLAAISLLQHAVPGSQWTLIASNDAGVSPQHQLPALRLPDGSWACGYTSIVARLAAHQPAYTTDADLTARQRADTLAYSTYLNSQGAALLALWLYVSPSSWTDVTRPAYSTLLPFPLTWTVPPSQRAAAIAKVEHLGLSHLAAAVEAEHQDGSTGVSGVTKTSSGFLRLPLRPTLSQALKSQPERANAIRLQALVDDFFAVLDDVRGDKEFLLDEKRPVSLDFLAVGYLELLAVPQEHFKVPERWLKYLETMHAGPVAWQKGKPEETLPWTTPAPRGVVGIASTFVDTALEHVPGLGEHWRRLRRGGVLPLDGTQQAPDSSHVAFAVAGALVSIGAAAGAVLFRTLQPLGAPTHRFDVPREQKRGLSQFGDLSAMLDGLPM